MNLSETEKAWLAGLIDGEGHVNYMRTARKGQSYTPVVQVGMCQPSAVYQMARLTGSKVHVQGPYGKVRRVIYVCSLAGNNAIELLEAVRPYLTVKAVEAWLVLEARAQCPPLRPGWEAGTRRGLTEEMVALRQGYSLALKWARSESLGG